VNIIISVHI